MRAAVFGSCMSNLTMARLQENYGYEQTHCIHHNRSDAFINYHLNNKPMIPIQALQSELLPKAEFEVDAKNILRNQYAEHLGLFQLEENRHKYGTFMEFARKENWDLILLDNFMDVAAKLMFDVINDPQQEKPLFLNPHFYQNEDVISEQYHHTPFLSPQESANNWLTICHWLRNLQPKAKIFFIPYHSCSSTENGDRHSRISQFPPIFSEMAETVSVNMLPPIEVKESLTKGQEDWPHYDSKIYSALAGHIYLSVEANLRPIKLR